MARPAFIPLAAGLQTELTKQLVQPGATLLSENMTSRQTGKAQVRYGADVLSTDTQGTFPSGGSLPDPWQLATLDGGLVRFNRASIPLHMWAHDPERWVRPDPSSGTGLTSYRRGPIKVDTSPVFSSTLPGNALGVPTVATSADAIVCVYQTASLASTDTVTVLIDTVTRMPLYTRRVTGASRARVMIVGTRAVVAYVLSNAVVVDVYSLTTFTFLSSNTFGATQSGTPLDMRLLSPVTGANNVAILYREDTGGELRLLTVDATNLGTNSTITPRTTAGAVVVPNRAFGWMQDMGLSTKFAIMIADGTNGLRVLWDLPAPTAGNTDAVATHVLDAAITAAPSGGTAGIRNLIGTTFGTSSTGAYRVLYEVTAPDNPTRAEIRSAAWTGSADLTVPFRSVGIRSKLWEHNTIAGPTNFYFWAAFAGTDQATYFTLAISGGSTSDSYPAPLATAFVRGAGGLTEETNGPTDVAVDANGAIFAAVTHETRTESVETAGTATGDTQRLLAVDLVRVRHATTAETEYGRPVEFIRSLFVPGGLLGQFDGQTYATAGFAYYPPAGTAAVQAGGNLEASATYVYRWLYSFVDRNGRKWRSAPSAPITVDTTGGDLQFEVTLETLRLIDRGGLTGQDGYQLELYRTQADAPGAHFLVASVANVPASHTLAISDNVADADLGEQLYTDGNGLENQLVPAMSSVVEHQGRLFGFEAGTATLWYTLEADLNNGLIWNEALTLDVADPSDPGTGLAVFGQTLFAFKDGRIYVIDGQGANALGQGATYTFRQIDVGVGCSNPQSIVTADDGVWFRSSSTRVGIHRTAGGAPEYVGGGVRAYDDTTITGAVVVPHETQIRWYTEEGRTLVLDWTTRSWGTNTGQDCLTVVAGYHGVPGVVYARASDAFLLSEATADSEEPFEEAGATYKGKIRSPWYQIAGLAGFERIKLIEGVGAAGGPHDAVVRLYRNMNDVTPFQVRTKPFDGSEVRWNWQVKPSVQKSSALMIETEIDPATFILRPALPDLRLWLDSHLEVETTGALVTLWGDQSGNDFDYEDVGLHTQPDLVDGPPPYLEFSGTWDAGDLLFRNNFQGTILTAGSDYHIFAVVRPPAGYSGGVWGIGLGTGTGPACGTTYFAGTSSIWIYNSGSATPPRWTWTNATPFDGTSWYILEWAVQAGDPITSMTFTVDSVQQTILRVGDCPAPYGDGGSSVGALGAIGATAGNLPGLSGGLGSLLIYDEIQTGAALEAIRAYLHGWQVVASESGPEIVGVSLIPQVKQGLDKLGSSRRGT